MKRIAFIVDSLDLVFPEGPLKGGGNLVARYLIYEFAKKEDIELSIISGNSKQTEIPGVKEVINLKDSPLTFNHGFLENVKKYINKYDYCLFLNTESPYGNILIQAHTSEYRYTNAKNKFESWLIKTFYGKEKILYSRSRFTNENGEIFVVSERLKNDLIKNTVISEDQITVSYPGVEIREASKKVNETFTFGMTAATSLNKGSKDLIFAMFLLKILGYKFKVNAILSTPHKNRLILFLLKILGLKDYLNVWERQTDMQNFYCSCDCILFPSLNETFGLVALEAASYKIPSIISSTTGVAEIFTNDKNALIYTKEHFPIFNLFKAMHKILKLYETNKQKYDNIANQAFEIAQTYTWNKFANKIYQKIMEK